MSVPRLSSLAIAISVIACSDVGPGVAVRLRGSTIDGKPFPASFPMPGNTVVTIAEAFLVGTNWGAACGITVRLTSGATTAGDVADCKLLPGESRTVTVSLPDARFPQGPHTYVFVPE